MWADLLFSMPGSASELFARRQQISHQLLLRVTRINLHR
jgi:hypothetical protein